MDPITLIVAAITAGVVAAARPVAETAVKDAYAGVRRLLIDKYEARKNLATAWQGVEQDPQNKLWQQMLAQELKAAGAEADREVLAAVRDLHQLLVQSDPQAYGDVNIDLEKIKATGSIKIDSETDGGRVDVKGREWEAGDDIHVSSKTGPKDRPPA